MGWSLGSPTESQRASPTQSTWPASLLLGHAIPSVWTLLSLQVHLEITSVGAQNIKAELVFVFSMLMHR